MDDEIKIGDTVRLINCHRHNSDAIGYDGNITFDEDEINNHIEILDILSKVRNNGAIAYKVKCKKGITYLRRGAFDTLVHPMIEEPIYAHKLIEILIKLGVK